MTINQLARSRLMMAYRLSGAALLSATLAACAAGYANGPEEVQASNPKVTYSYSSDDELLQASAKATDYCSQFQARSVRADTVVNDPEDGNSVTFECVPAAAAISTVAMAPAAPPLTYRYTSSQDLLQASASAENYCGQAGKHANATITSNADGSKTVSFQCVP